MKFKHPRKYYITYLCYHCTDESEFAIGNTLGTKKVKASFTTDEEWFADLKIESLKYSLAQEHGTTSRDIKVKEITYQEIMETQNDAR